MLSTIAALAGILIAALLIYAATKPDTFRVQRTKTIHATPEDLFALIDDFHNWSAWSPYEKLDPSMNRTYSGAASGKGAVYAWAGKGKAGAGRMEITGVSRPSKITIQLDFLKPFTARNTAEFTLDPDRDATHVTWAVYGPQTYFFKLVTLIFDRDKLVGGDFETGLTNLKSLVEPNLNQRSMVCS